MALTNFFSINMPYGMYYEKGKGWVCFNREYKPLGYNISGGGFPSCAKDFFHTPIFTNYKVNNEQIQKLVDKFDLDYRIDPKDGKIGLVIFYDSDRNPLIHWPKDKLTQAKKWKRYFSIIQQISNWKPMG